MIMQNALLLDLLCSLFSDQAIGCNQSIAMEPFSALAVATGVITFVDFGSKLVTLYLQVQSFDQARPSAVSMLERAGRSVEQCITHQRNMRKSPGRADAYSKAQEKSEKPHVTDAFKRMDSPQRNPFEDEQKSVTIDLRNKNKWGFSILWPPKAVTLAV
jgi:hypothetical protein